MQSKPLFSVHVKPFLMFFVLYRNRTRTLDKNRLTLNVPIPKKRKNLNFYFHTSLWCLKRFYEGLKSLHKTFWGTTKKCEIRNLSFNLSFISIQHSEIHGLMGRVIIYIVQMSYKMLCIFGQFRRYSQ